MNVEHILGRTHFMNACRNGHKYVVKSLQNSSICTHSEVQNAQTSFGLVFDHSEAILSRFRTIFRTVFNHFWIILTSF